MHPKLRVSWKSHVITVLLFYDSYIMHTWIEFRLNHSECNMYIDRAFYQYAFEILFGWLKTLFLNTTIISGLSFGGKFISLSLDVLVCKLMDLLRQYDSSSSSEEEEAADEPTFNFEVGTEELERFFVTGHEVLRKCSLARHLFAHNRKRAGLWQRTSTHEILYLAQSGCILPPHLHVGVHRNPYPRCQGAFSPTIFS